MKFSAALPPGRPADKIIVLPPQAFADAYSKRPQADVAVGLRRLSERETITALTEARKEGSDGGREGEAAIERLNEALLCWSLSFATCDPNDVSKPYFERADEEVREAFPPETLRRLWDELELLHAGGSLLLPEASDTDLAELTECLAEGALSALTPPKALRVRRWLRFCLDELRAAADDSDDDPA